MCRHHQVLAQSNANRMISQCEHQVVHLNWDIATIRLRSTDFLTFTQVVDGLHLHTSAANITKDWCQCIRDRSGKLTLWIGPIGLAIQAEDVTSFLSMLDQASEQIDTQGTQRTVNIIHECPILSIDPNALTMN